MSLSGINLSLNDFRGVLGKVNDGNVVFTGDKSGIEKANYGSAFLNLFRKVRKAPDDPEENARIRLMLISAIQTSAEGKVLSTESMDRIFDALGMPNGLDVEGLSKPLSRRELKSVLDIVDQATENNALVRKNIDAIKKADLYHADVDKAVSDAIDTFKFLKKGTAADTRVALTKEAFGSDFRGRSPAEMDRFIMDNRRVIRDQLYDRLYWGNVGGRGEIKVSEEDVMKVFKEVVGDLMEKYASGGLVTTKLETLAPAPKDVGFNDGQSKEVWTQVIDRDKAIEGVVGKVFDAPQQSVNAFASRQLGRAQRALNNLFVETFNTLMAEHHFNTQETEKAFQEKMGPLLSVLREIGADLDAMGAEAAGKVREAVADEIGKLVVSQSIGTNTSRLADAVVKALDTVVKDFSTRHVVEDFVNANFGYLEDKKPVVDFFMDKIAHVGAEGGITVEQRTKLGAFQQAVFSGGDPTLARQEAEFSLLNPLAQAYNEKLEQADPERVRQLRQVRNEKVLTELVAADPGYASMSAPQRAEALLKFKVEILISKFGYEGLHKLGVTASSGTKRILKEVVKDEKTGETKKGQNDDPKALEKLETLLLEMDDREFEFFTQYSAKGMGEADIDIATASAATHQGKNENVFRTALRDGAFSVSSVPKKAVPLLQKVLVAQIYAPLVKDSRMTFDVAIRDLIPRDEMPGPLTDALQARLATRFAATGIKPVPWAFQTPAKDEKVNETAMRLANSGTHGFVQVHGFGTLDLGRILGLFSEMGISLAPLDGQDEQAKVDVYEKVMCLSTLAAMSGFKLDGLAEFIQRTVGKPFSEVTFTDVIATLNRNEKVLSGTTGNGVPTCALDGNLLIADPLDKLAGGEKTVKELLSGESTLSSAGLSPTETVSLLTKARELGSAEAGSEKTVSVRLKGVDVSLTRLASGGLRVKAGAMVYRAAFDADGIVRMLENEITSKPASFDADVVKSALPPIDVVKSGRVPLVRARELYAKTAAAKTGTLPVMFSAYTTEELREIAVKAVDGKFTAADLPKDPPATYNSGAMIEMHANLSLTSASEIDSKVKINVPEGRSIELRRTVEPDAQTVRNVIADLFLNKDTWEFDAGASGKAQTGERVRKLLVEHAPELDFIIKGLKQEPDLLAGLPELVRTAVREVLEDVRGLNLSGLAHAQDVSDETRQFLASIEAKIGSAANALADVIQEKVTALFAPAAGADVEKPDWQKTFAELNGKEGLDVSTKQGAFTMTILRSYFTNSAPVDKRAMLSAFIRNTDAGSSDAKLVAEALKGAGPLLQKILQGLPMSSFNAETQLALKDMKSRLLPIPDEAVKAQMLELVRSSNGAILSLEVKRSLGAASVGQAFLCTIKTKAHPYVGEECVVKLLRPNVDTAIQREKALIDQLIANDPAMKATFDGQYRKILEEFDLTLESENVGLGTKVYELPGGVQTLHTMQMLEGTQSTMTSMIVKKAEGSTFDSTIDTIRGEAEAILAPLRQTTVVGGKTKTVYKADTAAESAVARRRLIGKVARLNDRRNHILDVARAWFDNALFGNGFFHGDLHGGNLMTAQTGTTFIDFGNCSRLSKAEQDAIKMMLATTISGDFGKVIEKFTSLMPPEAKAVFQQKFPEKSPGEKRLQAILSRGNALDLMPRLQAFLSAVQGEDVPIPPALQNFVQSYMRLNDILEEIDRTVADIEIAAASIYCDIPEIAPVEGESKFFAGLKAVARAFTGSADAPYSKEAVNQAVAGVNAYLETEEGKEEVRKLAYDPQKALGTLKPFLSTLNAVKFCGRSELELKSDPEFLVATLGILELERALEGLERQQKESEEGKLPDPEEMKKVFERIESNILSCAKAMGDNAIRQMSSERDGTSTFVQVAVKKDKSMTDVCTDVIFAHKKEVGTQAMSELGFVGAMMFAGKLQDNFTAAEEDVKRRKDVGPALERRNAELSPGERLSGRELATISRATNTFLVQSPRPDAEPGWCKDKKNRADILAAIGYNISRAAAAMALGDGEHLADAAVRLAARSFGLSDGKLIKSISGLSEEDFNQLVADADVIDTGNGGHELATALAELRAK